jgi:hypothetical protein
VTVKLLDLSVPVIKREMSLGTEILFIIECTGEVYSSLLENPGITGHSGNIMFKTC